MEKDRLKKKIERKARKEYVKFKREMLRQSKGKIWNSCQKIQFYGCIMEYFHYGKESGHSWDVLQKVNQPIRVMWECYQQNEHLEYSTWKEIESILDALERKESGSRSEKEKLRITKEMGMSEGIDLEKLFGEYWDNELKELLSLFSSEWMTRLSRKLEKEKPEKYQEANRRFVGWEETVKNHCPDLVEENQQIMDWIAGYYGEELETYYLSGVRDGIRFFKWIMGI